MSKGKNAEDGGRPDYEYWSRRPYFGQGKSGKRMTHQAERRVAKIGIARARSEDMEDRYGVSYIEEVFGD